MPDNWGFVAAAYLIAGVVLFGYWRRLQHRERELAARSGASGAASRRPAAGRPPS